MDVETSVDLDTRFLEMHARLLYIEQLLYQISDERTLDRDMVTSLWIEVAMSFSMGSQSFT